MPIGSFGHTGFTGTSIWIDPVTGAYVVFLSSRLHPDGKGDVTPLRARVTTIAAAASDQRAAARRADDVGAADGRAAISGRLPRRRPRPSCRCRR